MINGRTDLRVRESRAKFDAEADFDVRSGVAPPKSTKIDKKLISKKHVINIITSHEEYDIAFQMHKVQFPR